MAYSPFYVVSFQSTGFRELCSDSYEIAGCSGAMLLGSPCFHFSMVSIRSLIVIHPRIDNDSKCRRLLMIISPILMASAFKNRFSQQLPFRGHALSLQEITHNLWSLAFPLISRRLNPTIRPTPPQFSPQSIPVATPSHPHCPFPSDPPTPSC